MNDPVLSEVSDPQVGSTKPVSILLVDDDDGDVMAVRRAFRSARVSSPIVRAVDGQAALDLLRDRSPELPAQPFLVLVDINMPRMDGHEFVSRLRSDPELKKLVVFMLTTSNAREDVEAAYCNNVAGYIAKETAGTDFRAVVGTLKRYWNLVEMPELR